MSLGEKVMYQILVVDDEPKIVELLQLYLEMQGYCVLPAYDGRQAWELWQSNKVDMVLADIMMPHMDGYSLVERIRRESHVPIIFLSAKTELSDKIKGLNLGTDDYIVKPFDPLEVTARVTANLRRCYGYEAGKAGKEKKLTCRNLTLDMEKCCLLQEASEIELTAMEYRILRFFMENQGRVLTKSQIYEAVWEDGSFPDDNSIMVAISKLRAKLNDEEYHYIRTIRGLGYRMETV